MEDVELLRTSLEGEHPPAGGAYRQPEMYRRRSRKGETDTRIRELLHDHPRGLTADGVGKALSLSRSAAARRLGALARAGELEAGTYGRTRVFTLSRRADITSVLKKPAPLVLTLSPGLRVTGANDRLLSVFRLGAEELAGRKLARSPLARYLGEQVIGEIRKGSGGVADLPEFGSLVGDVRYLFRGRVTPLAGRHGPAGIIVTLEDVTGMALHRRKAEEFMDGETLSLLSSHPTILGDILEQRGEEDRLRLVEASVDQAGVAAFWTGRDGHILRANHATAAALGYGEEELARLAYSDLDLDHPPGSWDALWDTLRGRLTARFAARFRKKGGEHLRVEVRASHVSLGDREWGFFIAEETASRGAEDALRQANERLNLLTAVTRHDALNDIAALSMYLEILTEDRGEGTGSAVPVGKLVPLVHSLRRRMEFTRDYAGLGAKAPGWEDVAGAVGRAVAGMDTGRLRVDLDLTALEVYADPLFERAVANLVDNTLRHGEHASCLRFRARQEGDTCTLIIEDDGAGIPRGIKEAVFRPGFGRHTGLGLYLIREILGITGMSIAETGEPGKGARFEIHIPPGRFRTVEGPLPSPREMKMTMETRRTV